MEKVFASFFKKKRWLASLKEESTSFLKKRSKKLLLI